MTKPDRFERIVGELAGSLRLPVVPNEHDDSLHARWRTTLIAQFTRLLRREHQATVRAVKKLNTASLAREKIAMAQASESTQSDYEAGYQAACADILAMLERRKR
jgi:hypothetical protein